ncbi:MAG: hypothetical protein ABW223_05825 [Rariglobus sp.]
MKKKSTVKAAKSVTPAKKAPVKIVKKPAAASVKRAAAPAAKVPAAKTPVAKSASAKAPAVKASTPKARATVVTALVDVGFGNTLYVRGEGAGLSWEKGVALDCTGDTKWSISLPASGKTVIYKFLLNDVSWSSGADFVVESGTSVTVEPTF